MRILFLAHRLPFPPNKGDKIRSFWELKAISAQHQVDVFCFYDDREDATYLGETRQLCRHLYAEPISRVWSRARALFAVATRRPFSTGYFYSATMAAKVRRALREHSYDLIWVFSSSMAQYAEGSSLPKIVDFVDVDSDKWQQYAKRTRAPWSWLWAYEARQLGRYENFVARNFSASVLCTEAEAHILRRRVNSRPIYAVNNFVDGSYFDPSIVPLTPEVRGLQPYVVFTGQMDYYPNIDAAKHFYQAIFPAVRAKAPVLKFVIAGRNPVSSVRRLASDPAVVVTGSVPDIRPYLRGAAAAVMPLRIARGVQNKILEAMAMGLQVFVSGAVAAALPAHFSSLLVVEDDPDLMAGKLSALLSRSIKTSVPDIRAAALAAFGRAQFQEQLQTVLQKTTADSIAPGHARRQVDMDMAAEEEKRSVPLSAPN